LRIDWSGKDNFRQDALARAWFACLAHRFRPEFPWRKGNGISAPSGVLTEKSREHSYSKTFEIIEGIGGKCIVEATFSKEKWRKRLLKAGRKLG
jgi:hypothetical protein